MNYSLPQDYVSAVKQRSEFKYLIGLINRIFWFSYFNIIRFYASARGAKVGKNSVITWRLAKRANSNLVIGNNVVIEAYDLDLRDKIIIQDNVIINRDVSILRVSHYIDNPEFKAKYYGPLIIEPFSWIATGAKILPSVSVIRSGSICSAYSLIVKNTDEMGVYAGNPASILKYHNRCFDNKIVPALQTNDLLYYIKARKL